MRFTLLLVSALFFILTSCVPTRKYEDLQMSNRRLAEEFRQNTEDLKTTRAGLTDVQQQLTTLKAERQQTLDDLATARQRYTELDRTNRDLLDRYDRLLAENSRQLQVAGGTNQELTTRVAAQQEELARRERELQTNQARLSELERELQVREARVAELTAAINEKDARLKAIKSQVDAALRGFSAADLTVEERNGRIYVSLSQNLLFPSGSKTLNAQGKNALSKLAGALKSNQQINITVEGHTDTDGDAALNWDLSVGRATTVVKELTANGVDPKRVTAAGRGEFFPVADNTSAAGKARNRRTEIILTPQLDALYNLID